MKLRKNFAAKVASLAASLIVLGGVWVTVRQRPPASASDAGATPAPTQTSNSMTSGANGSSRTPTSAPRTHTRTHVS